MSWDASFSVSDDHGHPVTPYGWSWNYTHNCNRMIEEALGAVVADTEEPWWSRLNKDENVTPALGSRSWWGLLDGQSGVEGSALLSKIITELRRDPDHYDNLGPNNGWGDRESLLEVLDAMLAASQRFANGRWSVSG